jgi:large subunit ribosomal protein L9
MATEVLLMADVANLGHEGDVVKVADGYARNFLLPKKLAAPVTEATRRKLSKIRLERDAKHAADLASARDLAAKTQGLSVTIRAKTGSEEKLFGSVSAANILEAVAAQGIQLPKHAIELEHPIKELGVFEVKAKLHPEVEATIKVWVVEE